MINTIWWTKSEENQNYYR